MRLQCTLSVCSSELRETSSKLPRKGTCHQQGSFILRLLHPARRHGIPSPQGPSCPQPPHTPGAQLPMPTKPPTSSSPLNPLIHEVKLFRNSAFPLHTAAYSYKPPLYFKLPSLPTCGGPCFTARTQNSFQQPHRKAALWAGSGEGGGGVGTCAGLHERSRPACERAALWDWSCTLLVVPRGSWVHTDGCGEFLSASCLGLWIFL